MKRGGGEMKSENSIQHLFGSSRCRGCEPRAAGAPCQAPSLGTALGLSVSSPAAVNGALSVWASPQLILRIR